MLIEACKRESYSWGLEFIINIFIFMYIRAVHTKIITSISLNSHYIIRAAATAKNWQKKPIIIKMCIKCPETKVSKNAAIRCILEL